MPSKRLVLLEDDEKEKVQSDRLSRHGFSKKIMVHNFS